MRESPAFLLGAFFFGVTRGEQPLVRASRASKVAGAFLVLFWHAKENIPHYFPTQNRSNTSLMTFSDAFSPVRSQRASSASSTQTDTASSPNPPLTASSAPATASRARDAVAGALDAVSGGFGLDAVSVCVDDALDALCDLTGENASENVINEVFERFCVGK